MKRKYLDNRPIIRLLSQRSLVWDIWDPNWFEEAYTPYFLCKGYQKLLQSSSRLVRVSAPEDQGCSLDVTQSDFTFFKMQIKMTYDVERIFNIISESEVQWSWQKGKVIIGGEGSVRTWHGSRGLSFPHPCLRLCRGLWVWLHQEINFGGTLGIKKILIWLQPNWKQFSSWKVSPAPITGPLGLLWHRSFCLAGPHCLLHVWGW